MAAQGNGGLISAWHDGKDCNESIAAAQTLNTAKHREHWRRHSSALKTSVPTSTGWSRRLQPCNNGTKGGITVRAHNHIGGGSYNRGTGGPKTVDSEPKTLIVAHRQRTWWRRIEPQVREVRAPPVDKCLGLHCGAQIDCSVAVVYRLPGGFRTLHPWGELLRQCASRNC